MDRVMVPATEAYVCPNCKHAQTTYEVRQTAMAKIFACPGCRQQIRREGRFRPKR